MRNLILTLMIWIICFTAIVMGASMTYTWYRERGIDIFVNFTNVEGLVPDQSKVLYKGVEIGVAKKISLNPETGNPRIMIRVDRQIIPLLGPDSKFWVVRPELGIGQVRNLGTIATGDYITVNPAPGPFTSEFTALDEAPIDHKFGHVMRIRLKSPSSSGIEIGTAVLYRGFQIGEVGDMKITPDKRSIQLSIYIDDIYKGVIRRSSYFANISGFHADINIFSGTKLSMDSLRTLIKGGITVTTPDLNSPPAKADDCYTLLTAEQYQELQS